MSLSSKKQLLMSRYGYRDSDFQDYAIDHNCAVPIAIDRLFYHHIAMNKKQAKLFDEQPDIDTKAAQEIDGRLF